jgi:hypothetical protein
MLLLAMFFTWFSRRVQNILIGLVTFMLWFSLGMWLFFSSSPPLAVGEAWVDVLAWAFVILAFLPLLFQMDVEIKHEEKGKSWTRYGQPPERKGPSAYEEYREKLFARTRRR